MFQEISVAAISFVPKKFDLDHNTEQLESAIRQAAKKGAQLIVTPEGGLEGYVVNEIIEGRASEQKMHEVAQKEDSWRIQHFRDLAKELDVCLTVGFAEKQRDGVYNTAVFINSRGRTCGKYQKMQFAEGYDPVWWFNRIGKHIRAFNTPFGRCGFLICNDRSNKMLWRTLALDRVQYILIPTFGSTSRDQTENILACARENGLPVVQANVGLVNIVSKGEFVVRKRGKRLVEVGTIAIPASPGSLNRHRQEEEFLAWREDEMPRRLAEARKKSKEQDNKKK